MDLSTLLTTIASQGLLGILLIVVGVFAWSKDRELKAEREARVADAKDYTKIALDLQEQVLDAVNKLADILDEMKRMRFGRPPVGGDR